MSKHEAAEHIFRCMAQIERNRTLHSVLGSLSELARELVEAERCTVWMVDEAKGQIWTVVADGLERLEMPIGQGLAGYAAQHGEAFIVNDPYSDSRFHPGIDKKSGYHTRTVLLAPIRGSEGEILGIFQALNRRAGDRMFTEEDIPTLTVCCTYAAESLEKALLIEEVENTQTDLVFMLGEVAERRSKETANHVRRVAEYSHILAQHLGFSEPDADMLKRASPMHDVGKIAIPDAILNKPGRYTDEDMEIMKNHTAYGYEMLKGTERPLFQTAAIVAYEHHEKFNGSGYPRGLAGEDIHIYGRITAVADVFDALGTKRVYKDAWSMEKILKLFREERGEHFDPDIADILLHHTEEFVAVRDRLPDV